MNRYFAYGSALSMVHVNEWAAEHGVDPAVFAGGAPAVLRGYRLVFDVESRFWGGRVANLTPDASGAVHGVLFDVPAEAVETVLRKEGVPTGLSQPLEVTVEAAGAKVSATAFVARPEKRGQAGAPSGRLMQFLLEGARTRGLPPEWIDELQRHAASAAQAQPQPGRVGLGKR